MTLRAEIICLLFSSILKLTIPEAFLSIKFITFHNPRALKSNGECCDGNLPVCGSPCDHKFLVCLDHTGGAPNDFTKCVYGKKISSEIPDSNYIRFKDRIGDLQNPMVWILRFWPGQVLVKVAVADVDPGRAAEQVAHLHKIISAFPVNSSRGTIFTLGNTVKLTFETRAYCGSDYYSHDCSVHCKARDNVLGHYTCSPTNGKKICLTGWTGKECNINIDDCIGITCLNGGSCRDLTSRFECQCPAGFEGRFCEEEINECLSRDVCRHGQCINTPGSYLCTCLAGYSGEACNINIDDCTSLSCQNGAICIDRVNDFECVCSAGYTGKFCDKDLDECQHMPCKNNGSCLNNIGAYRCDCPMGYQGNDCSLDVDECIYAPCLNRGICINHPGGYKCQCHLGYEGKHCENNINECLNKVCKNGGKCTDLDGSFQCECTEFWEGRTCEKNINECLSSPCKHGGICQNTEEGFLCFCPVSFLGRFCEQDLNECEVDIFCQNNSTCFNSFGSYVCECSIGWKGPKCEEIDKCDTLNCSNSGICIKTKNGFQCKCTANWTGENCELDVDECSTSVITCRNNATCHNTIGGFSCECSAGWTGSVCDRDVNECILNPDLCTNVLNNSSSIFTSSTDSHFMCLNTLSGYECVCEPGWHGSLCNEDIDECVVDPHVCTSRDSSVKNTLMDLEVLSKSHSVCINANPGYLCLCAEGWAGMNCNVENDSSYSGPTETTTVFSSGDSVFGRIRHQNTLQVSQTGNTSVVEKNPRSHQNNNALNVSVPFYLACRITSDIKSSINNGLKQMLLDTRSFLWKEVTVNHKSEVGTSENGDVVTSIHPVITVDGKLITDHDLIQIIKMVSHNFTNYLSCPLYLDKVRGKFIFTKESQGIVAPNLFLGLISGCVLVVVIALTLAAFIVFRRTRMSATRKYHIKSVETSRSFRNIIRCKSVKMNSEDKGVVNRPRPQLSEEQKSDATEEAQGLQPVSATAREVHFANEGHMPYNIPQNNSCVAASKIYIVPHKVSMAAQDSQSAFTYANVVKKNDDKSHAGPQGSWVNECSFSTANQSYVQMTEAKVFKADVHASNLAAERFRKRLTELGKLSPEMECEKYKSLPYIDDPAYAEIIINE